MVLQKTTLRDVTLSSKVNVFVLLLLLWQLHVSHAGPELPDRPFNIVWNVPSRVCAKKFGVEISLDGYEIVYNPGHEWNGTYVTIFYAKDLGLYPSIHEHTGEETNWGLPQPMFRRPSVTFLGSNSDWLTLHCSTGVTAKDSTVADKDTPASSARTPSSPARIPASSLQRASPSAHEYLRRVCQELPHACTERDSSSAHEYLRRACQELPHACTERDSSATSLRATKARCTEEYVSPLPC
ncbi:positive regulation of hyaluranon cable assembly [Branchiostoma belcheri]|nr:positive regulation of hyaluranon cable assembly [Branchiostoma belcheri]